MTYGRFKKHCELNPEWAVEAWRISKANCRIGKIARFRAMTHCKYGHPLADASFYQKDGYVARHCRICRLIRAKRPAITKPENGEKVRALLKANASISSFTKAGTRSYVMNYVTFTQFRREKTLKLICLQHASSQGHNIVPRIGDGVGFAIKQPESKTTTTSESEQCCRRLSQTRTMWSAQFSRIY